MATTTPLVTNLDFDDIKASLQAYLQGQTEFTDYDFEGSGLVQLLNILSLNTHYNAILANAGFNETFLDTAIKRSNVVSRAKEIGYTARSARSATALVNLLVTNPTQTPSNLTLPQYTQFGTTINGTDFTFYNIAPITTPLVDGSYTYSNLKLYEGALITNTFTYDGVSAPYFEIPNEAVDLTTLSVTVQANAGATTITPFNFANSIIGVTGTSNAYFIQEDSNELYQVYFGDGAIGSALQAGNVITLTYLVSSLDAANVSATKFTQVFSYAGSIGGNSDISITTVSNSVGGIDKEDAATIQFNAPLSLARQDRIITANDYLSAIGEQETAVQAVSVWGGEDNIPPTYGKVFISLKPYDGYVISQAVQDDIVNNVLGLQGNMLVTPVFVDPDYIYINLNVQSTYDPSQTTVTSDDIEGYITTTITNYFAQQLSKYKQTFRFSVLSRLIDATNDSLISNIMTMQLQKRITFPYNYATNIDVTFPVPVLAGSMSSNIFTYSVNDQLNVACQFVDDGKGNVSVMNSTTASILSPNVGTVNYTTGEVIVNGFVITGLLGGVEDIRIMFSPQKAITDISSNLNQIIELDDSTAVSTANILAGLTVTVEAEE
jgi:hypothetical protein